jgi:hypothetical protein
MCVIRAGIIFGVMTSCAAAVLSLHLPLVMPILLTFFGRTNTRCPGHMGCAASTSLETSTTHEVCNTARFKATVLRLRVVRQLTSMALISRSVTTTSPQTIRSTLVHDW